MARRRKGAPEAAAVAAPAPPAAAAAPRASAEVEPAYTLVRSLETPSQLVLTLELPGVEGAPSEGCSLRRSAHASAQMWSSSPQR